MKPDRKPLIIMLLCFLLAVMLWGIILLSVKKADPPEQPKTIIIQVQPDDKLYTYYHRYNIRMNYNKWLAIMEQINEIRPEQLRPYHEITIILGD